MPQTKLKQSLKTHSRPGQLLGRGFTLVELVAVLILMGILAAVAVPALGTTEQTRHAAAARLIASDLRFARQHAVATGTRCWVSFETVDNQWTVLSEDANSPGRADASPITDTATDRPMIQRLDALFKGEHLLNIGFDGGVDIGFSWLGQPLSETESALAANGSVTLVSGFVVTVAVDSGLVSVVKP